jgi:hypothetical protein
MASSKIGTGHLSVVDPMEAYCGTPKRNLAERCGISESTV